MGMITFAEGTESGIWRMITLEIGSWSLKVIERKRNVVRSYL